MSDLTGSTLALTYRDTPPPPTCGPRPPCATTAYDTAARDAATIARLPKLAPLLRRINRERQLGAGGARNAQQDLNILRSTVSQERKLADAIVGALKPCTSG